MSATQASSSPCRNGSPSASGDVSVIPFDSGCANNAEPDLNQIRTLFVEGMKDNESPEEYIESSLKADLNDPDSMGETYFSGNGTFLMLVEPLDYAGVEATTHSASCSDDGSSNKRRRRVKGAVGLQDMTTTEAKVDGIGIASEDDKGKKLLQLRRMSIDSSCRGSGYGARLVRECISHAKENNFDGIKLYTGGWMHSAINFYRKFGFEKRAQIDYKVGHEKYSHVVHLELLF